MLDSSSPSVVSNPVAEVLVEGELSPFEHEALYKLPKKHFRLEQPSYSELLNGSIGTRVNMSFIIPTSPLVEAPCFLC